MNLSKEHIQYSSMYNFVTSSNNHWQPAPVNPLPLWPLNYGNYMLSGWPRPGQGFYGGQSMSGGFHGGHWQSYHGGPPGTSFYSTSSFYSTPPRPVYQGTSPNHSGWQHTPNQYQPPPKPKRQLERKKWSRKAVHPHPYNAKPESSGAIYYDRSTGVYRTYSPNDANNNTRIAKVWETPTKKPIHG